MTKTNIKTIRIDFGPSTYAMHSPNISPEELKDYGVVEVAESGSLPPIRKFENHFAGSLLLPKGYYRNFKKILGEIKPIISGESIILNFSKISPSKSIEELIIRWIPERKEWIGVSKESWCESSTWGWDESYRGPYELDVKYAKKIIESYNIPKGKISSKRVLHTEPSALEKIASREVKKKK